VGANFLLNKNRWGLRYALSRLNVDYLPANPVFKHYVRSKLHQTPRLQLGCGNTICDGWLHQDRKTIEGVDFVIDVRRLRKYVDSNSLEAIMTSHMLEHLPRHEAKELMVDFRNWLRSGGELWISVPDLTILYGIARDPNTLEEDRDRAMMTIATPTPGHISAWFFEDISRILASFGFNDIRRWDEPPVEFKKAEGCWTHCIGGKLISLNVYAKKQ
jgi:hypothetical protein